MARLSVRDIVKIETNPIPRSTDPEVRHQWRLAQAGLRRGKRSRIVTRHPRVRF